MYHLIIFFVIILGIIIIKCLDIKIFSKECYVINSFVQVKESSKSGRGVYAMKDYKKGDIIEVCPAIKNAFSDLKGKVKDYIFKYDDTDSLIAFGYCSIYNHDDNPNAQWMVVDDETIQIICDRDIKNGEEIFVSYGQNYWNSRKIEKI